jgi:hypothetical protein
MERTYRVTTIKTVKLRVNDACLTPDAVREFSEAIFEATADEMMSHAASQVAAHGEIYVEGIGRAALDFGGDSTPIAFTCEVESVEVEDTP